MLPPAAAACCCYVVASTPQATKSAAPPHARPSKLLLLLQLLQAGLCMLLLLPGRRQHGMIGLKSRTARTADARPQMVVAFWVVADVAAKTCAGIQGQCYAADTPN
jgi:hypothetical protein